ncbi:MAG: hypothetical protein HKN42_13490 [Granulosicoccus sp.]|nr:hypothetical protein [Granulosicoccus sp.]
MKISYITTAALTLALSLTASMPAMVTAGELHGSYYLSTSSNEFDVVVADLQDAIVNQGLVVDFVGHSGDMLERTAEALETESPLSAAQYINFCSAKLTHAAIAASPENMAICPYVVFAYQVKSEPDTVYLGFRRPAGATGEASEQALADIESLMQALVDEATE